MTAQAKLGDGLIRLGGAAVLAGPVGVLLFHSSVLLPLVPLGAAAFVIGIVLLATARRP
jgi:hypothetical protein